MDHDEIARLNHEYGGDWAIQHSERLLHLVAMLGEGVEYDHEAVWLAAYLHDWGGYEKWMVSGVDHNIRSAEVARGFLEERGCPDDLKELVLEIIVNHHGGPADRSIESILFTDADALDLLGVVGTLRVFSMWPRNLQGAVATTKRYREMCIAALTSDKAKKIAKTRIRETDDLLAKFEEETFGIY
ncbi:MAG: HD domain-containing protein [Armatimonadota bacterium]|nr:HD domain-containing protein [bacterium]